jgi:hypothetical protein
MSEPPYIKYYACMANGMIYYCRICGSSLYPDSGINLWCHYMKAHHGIGTNSLAAGIHLWIDVSNEVYAGKISNIALSASHMFKYYPQAAYLEWEINPVDFMKLLFKTSHCRILDGMRSTNHRMDYYYCVCEEDYNLIDSIMRIQSYSCMFPDCEHRYDCLPSAEVIHAHVNEHHNCLRQSSPSASTFGGCRTRQHTDP